MKKTRREFIQSALTGVTFLAVGGNAIAQMPPDPKAVMGMIKQQQSTGNMGEGPVAVQEGVWHTIRVSDGTEMRVYSVYPRIIKERVQTAPPAVMVLQEAFGVNAHIRDVTRRIATLGYVAVAPELYHRTGAGFESGYEDTSKAMEVMRAVTIEGLTADLQATYAMLQADKRVDSSRIGSVGYCMGGRASFLANAILPLKAAASYYGAGIGTTLLPQAKDQHGPILLFWGGKDQHIGVEQPRAVADALRAAGKLSVSVEFSDAEHGFFCDVRKSYNPIAAKESWALLVTFFKEYLEANS